jgi:hypothetical protein
VIIQWLVTILAAPLVAMLNLLPAWTPVDLDAIVNAIESVNLGSWFRWMNYYLPVGPGLVALGVVVAWSATTYVDNWGVWVLTKLHILGGE